VPAATRIDLATAAEQDYAAAAVLVNAVELRKRRLQQLTRPCRLPEPRQVRLQTVEEEPVALAEVAAARSKEEKCFRVPQGRRNRNCHFILDSLRPIPALVEPRPVQFPLGEEVRDLESFKTLLVA
jgi:hypothetical protein